MKDVLEKVDKCKMFEKVYILEGIKCIERGKYIKDLNLVMYIFLFIVYIVFFMFEKMKKNFESVVGFGKFFWIWYDIF